MDFPQPLLPVSAVFSGIDNQIEVENNHLIGMGIAKVFNNDTHKFTVFRVVDNIGVCTTHFQLLIRLWEQTNTVKAKHFPFE